VSVTFPSLLLAAVLAAAPTRDDAVAAGAVLSASAQWDALTACPRVVMGGVGAETSTGVALAVKDGFAYVLTAQHAVSELASEREVHFFTRDEYPRPARRVRAVEVAARWANPDLALLKVKVGSEPVPTLRLAGPGQRPTAYPFGAVSVGCSNAAAPTCRAEEVTAKRLARRPGGAIAFFWELSVAPVPGRSGGPLLDDHGRVIGICAAGQGVRGYYTHLDEILVALKRDGHGWLWQGQKD
jgi:S1-C subfamily serine protease